MINKVECASNQQINAIIPNVSVSSEYLFHFFKESYELLRTLAFGGSTMPILNKSEFEAINILVPPHEVMKGSTVYLDNLADKIFLNQKETETLIQLRDTLLPHLISGKVRVPEEMMDKLIS